MRASHSQKLLISLSVSVVATIGAFTVVFNIASTLLRLDDSYRMLKVPVVYGENVAKVLEQLHLPEKNGCQKVPKRLHQTWNTEMIPASQAKYVETWQKFHPDWEYWFWTAKTMDEFISRRFPKYIEMFRRYPMYMQRADAMRYFVIYEFGGVYADLDVSALKRWDDQLTGVHTLLIPEDHEAHTVLHGRESTTLSAIIMATPGHKFLAYVIRRLPEYDKRTASNDLLGKSGPLMVASALDEYKLANRSGPVSICDAVYIPSHNKFNPYFDEGAVGLFKAICTDSTQYARKKQVCGRLKASNFKNPPLSKSVYTNHAFSHTYGAGFRRNIVRNIRAVVTGMNFVNVTDRYMKLIGPNPELA